MSGVVGILVLEAVVVLVPALLLSVDAETFDVYCDVCGLYYPSDDPCSRH